MIIVCTRDANLPDSSTAACVDRAVSIWDSILLCSSHVRGLDFLRSLHRTGKNTR